MSSEALIIDGGSETIKSGFAFESNPRSIIPCAVGRPSVLRGSVGHEYYPVGVGEAAFEPHFKPDYPIMNRSIVNWDNMERVWHHVYYRELKCAPEDRPLMLAYSTLATSIDKEKAAEVLFETFNVPSLYMEAQAVLALYASGRVIGTIVDAGHGCTDITPIFEGLIMKHAVERINIGGQHVTSELKRMFIEKGYNFSVMENRKKIIDSIKTKMCFMVKDFDDEHVMGNVNAEKDYILPNGNIIKVGEEAYKSTEIFFKPALINSNDSSLTQAIIDAISKCDVQLFGTYYANIVFCGGASLLQNFAERLTVELLRQTGGTYIPQLHVAPERLVFPWIGGAILSQLSTFKNCWILRNQYNEVGSQIVKRR